MTRRALVTGGAGFIGSHVVDRMLSDGWEVECLDSFDPFYDPAIKRGNVAAHLADPRYRLVEVDILDLEGMRTQLSGGYDAIVHLAARAGVRPSIADPVTYRMVNIGGTQNLLELAKGWGTRQFVFASSSSVYGVNQHVPWREDDHVLLPISPYAATKVAGELLGHVYSYLDGIRFIALRFFTVYGPRQRPDLAIHKFARMMLAGKPIPLFGDGSAKRDYTYVADIVAGVVAAVGYTGAPYEIINLGNTHTVSLSELVVALEDALGVKAERQWLKDQPGDVPQTWADISRARDLLAFAPQTDLRAGLAAFAEWLRGQ